MYLLVTSYFLFTFIYMFVYFSAIAPITTFHIVNCKRTDSGEITLKVVNELGSDKANFYFNILDVPGIPTGPITYDDITGSSVTISWKKPKDDGGSPITGIIICLHLFNILFTICLHFSIFCLHFIFQVMRSRKKIWIIWVVGFQLLVLQSLIYSQPLFTDCLKAPNMNSEFLLSMIKADLYLCQLVRNIPMPFKIFINTIVHADKIQNLGCNQDGVIARRGKVSHHLQEKKPRESFPRSLCTNSMGMKPRLWEHLPQLRQPTCSLNSHIILV